MPASPSSSESPDQPDQQVDQPVDQQVDVPMSRADRRAAARAGKHGARTEVPVWNAGKVHGARGAQQRRQFTNRKTGG